jgi:hypothetical protein
VPLPRDNDEPSSPHLRRPVLEFIIADGASTLLGVPVGFGIGFVFTNQPDPVMRDVHRVEAGSSSTPSARWPAGSLGRPAVKTAARDDAGQPAEKTPRAIVPGVQRGD